MSGWMSIPNLLVWIPTLPLLAAVVTAITGPKWLRHRSHWPTLMALLLSCLLSCALVMRVGAASSEAAAATGWETTTTLWTWVDVAAQPHDFRVDITLRADALTALMLAMVTFVALLVATYAAGYMHGDTGYWRFFSYLSLFVFSMAMLVLASNFLLLFVFWEAVGACSYLLIGFWYDKPEAAAAGKKAFLVNRIGDFGFALGLFLIWTTYGTLNFHDADGPPGVFGATRLADPSAHYVGGGLGVAICLLLMLGACGKSAQFPLHVWLPDAMEGPTPVSALIHAATMVTAGVYMVIRCTPLFAVPAGPYVDPQLVVAVIGCFTAILAGLIALTQNDLKRVLAYSTISQLGFMFLSLGTGSRLGIIAGMFHLFTHAFFKALLFLGAGSVMHAMGGVIDIRRFGGLRKLMPITHATSLVGCLALAGVWPFAGFWSKDAILHEVHHLAHDQPLFFYLYWTATFTALLTAIYTFRAFFLTFYGPREIPAEAGDHAHESPRTMTIPLIVLAVGATVVGWWHESIATFLAHTPSLAYAGIQGAAYQAIPVSAQVFPTFIAVLGVGTAAFFFLGDGRAAAGCARAMKPLYALSYGQFFIDSIYQILFVLPLRALASLVAWFDIRILDGIVDGVAKCPKWVGAAIRPLQSGLVPYYALLMVAGVLVLIGSWFV